MTSPRHSNNNDRTWMGRQPFFQGYNASICLQCIESSEQQAAFAEEAEDTTLSFQEQDA